jgi:3-oxoacyl-[acyl-carrier protein] reductase
MLFLSGTVRPRPCPWTLRTEFGENRVESTVCDVTSESEVAALLAEPFGGTDVVINNAGLGGTASSVDLTDEEWSRVLDVTLTGAFRCVRAAARRMIARGTGGVIVNSASIIGWRTQEGQAHYAAARAGVMALTRCAGMDLAAHGIRVNAVSPSLAIYPFLAKVTSDEVLAEMTKRERSAGRRSPGKSLTSWSSWPASTRRASREGRFA